MENRKYCWWHQYSGLPFEGTFDSIDEAIEDVISVCDNDPDEFRTDIVIGFVEEFDYENVIDNGVEELICVFDNAYDDFQGSLDDDDVHYDYGFSKQLKELLLPLFIEKTDFSVKMKGIPMFQISLDDYKKNVKTNFTIMKHFEEKYDRKAIKK